MTQSSTWRVLLLAVICLPTVVGVWAAYTAGRSALGNVGGLLVALIGALMLGALLLMIGMLLFRSARPTGAPNGRTPKLEKQP